LTTNRGWRMTRTSRSRGVSGDDPARRSGSWRPGKLRSGRLGRPTQGLERALAGEALAAVPAAMPESERARACPRPKTVTAERREASAPIARCAPRLSKRGNYKDYAPVGAPPSPRRGGNKTKDRSRGAASAAGSGESCGSKRIAVRTNRESGCRGTSGAGLFDIVNRGRTAPHRLRLSAGATHRHALSSLLSSLSSLLAHHTRTVVPAQAGTQYSSGSRVWHDGSPLSRGRQHGRNANACPRTVFSPVVYNRTMPTRRGCWRRGSPRPNARSPP
jgi:hypothetical protein